MDPSPLEVQFNAVEVQLNAVVNTVEEDLLTVQEYLLAQQSRSNDLKKAKEQAHISPPGS